MKRFCFGVILTSGLSIVFILKHNDSTRNPQIHPLPTLNASPAADKKFEITQPTAVQTSVEGMHKNHVDRNENVPNVLNVDSIDLEAPDVNLTLVDLATQEENDPVELYDFVANLGPKGYPALGALAERLQDQHPDQALEIIDQLFVSLKDDPRPAAAMLVSWALMNAKSIDFTDKLYDTLRSQENPEVRYHLFGVLSTKQLAYDDKQKFRSLAMRDSSSFVRDLGHDWDRAIEGNDPHGEGSEN